MVLSTDSDVPILTGDNCISINGFSTTKIDLMSTSISEVEDAMMHVGTNFKLDAKIFPAVLPIFENVTNICVRAVMMLICGCDVYINGLNGTSLGTLSKQIHSFKNTSTDPQDEQQLLKYLIEIMKNEFKPRLVHELKEIYDDEVEHFTDTNVNQIVDTEAEEIVNTYIDALVYEPTNAAGKERTYLCGEAPS